MDSTDEDLDDLLRGVMERAAEREFRESILDLSPGYLARLREIEELPCNRPGQDKSWVLQVARRARALIAESRRLT